MGLPSLSSFSLTMISVIILINSHMHKSYNNCHHFSTTSRPLTTEIITNENDEPFSWTISVQYWKVLPDPAGFEFPASLVKLLILIWWVFLWALNLMKPLLWNLGLFLLVSYDPAISLWASSKKEHHNLVIVNALWSRNIIKNVKLLCYLKIASKLVSELFFISISKQN